MNGQKDMTGMIGEGGERVDNVERGKDRTGDREIGGNGMGSAVRGVWGD